MNIPIGTKVEVYWNLHKKVYSVRARSGEQRGRVIAHVRDFTLTNVTFSVSQAGRERVLAEGRKNVHAFVRGEWAGPTEVMMSKVTYNPYKYTTFVRARDGIAVVAATAASGFISEGRAVIASTP